VSFTAASYWRSNARLAPLSVVSLPLLTTDTQGQFAQCAAGAFDNYWRQIGANLKAIGAQGMVVRLGWEANIGSDNHPWGVDTPDQVPSFVQCWRHAAAQIESTAPGILFEWTNAKKTANTSISVLNMYPGDDVVDLWGVHYYDGGPLKNTQAIWDKYYNMTFNGGPWGLGTWLATAQQHGKKLAVSEYGISQQDGQTAAQADDPVYTDNMYRFFKSNASSIAYESYFNAMPDQHTLCNADGTPTAYPNAAATYQADWRLGQ
jgi:beta-mannanase